MKSLLTPIAILIATGTLSAQQSRVGIALNITAPVGTFQSTTGQDVDNQGHPISVKSGYDMGIGGQVTLSIPLDPKVAIRLGLSGHSMNGSNTSPGLSKINLRHSMFSLGADLQLFTDSAYRHRGTYFLAGLSADFERFDRSFDDIGSLWADVNTERKSRLGGTIGIGHTFGFDAGTRFTLEAAYHSTLSDRDSDPLYTPRNQFVRVGFGWVF